MDNVLAEKEGKELEEFADYNERVYKAMYKESVENPGKFWGKVAEELITWKEPWKEVFVQKDPMTEWFTGAKVNASYNAVDRHLNSHRKLRLL